MRIFLVLFLLLTGHAAIAQQDSIFVTLKNGKWMIPYETKLGESLFILARRFHVPPAVLADINGLNYQDGIGSDKIINIPFSSYNQAGAKPFDINAVKEVYYTVGPQDNLFTLSKYAGVPQRIMQDWNKLPDNTITKGQVLFAGWVLYDASQTPFSDAKTAAEQKNDGTATSAKKKADSVIVIKIPKVVKDTVSKIEREYLTQTDNEQNVTEEKGGVVFYTATASVKHTETYYAFYNGVAKGTIIKVYNPGSDKTLFVKVLGPLPATKQYYNSIMGLSTAAKNMLGATDNKAWCELKYAAQ